MHPAGAYRVTPVGAEVPERRRVVVPVSFWRGRDTEGHPSPSRTQVLRCHSAFGQLLVAQGRARAEGFGWRGGVQGKEECVCHRPWWPNGSRCRAPGQEAGLRLGLDGVAWSLNQLSNAHDFMNSDSGHGEREEI